MVIINVSSIYEHRKWDLHQFIHFHPATIFSLVYLVEMDQEHSQVQTDSWAKNCQFRSQNLFSYG